MVDARVAIVGAGSSGIAACQVLEERGIRFDCFEKGSDIGGLWRYENDNGLASAYHCLHTNTSREATRYASYPMPDAYPDFPHHTQMLAYLEDYVEYFGFRGKIRFRAEVRRVAPVDGAWKVDWLDASGQARSDRYTAVLVASGHHWDPRWPIRSLPGAFTGREIHSHFYRTPESCVDKNVLVIGIGDSAMDIACDTSRVSKMTFLTARRGAWMIPKYLDGVPIDQVGRKLQARSPLTGEVASGPLFNIARSLLARKIDSIQGRPEDHGLPKPDHKFAAGTATASSEILPRIEQGRVTPKAWISRLDKERVCFQDGSVEEIDVIVYCTGYRIALPFLAREILDPADNDAPLYMRVVHPDHPGLYFIGLVDVPGPLNPLSELQAEWVADLLEHRVQLPSRAQMQKAIAREDRRRERRFGAPKRHAIHVDYYPYRRALQRERKRRRRGHASQRNPVAAGAGASGLDGSPSAGTGSL
jgi:dimethylaniline monooxygenase (N-oxide forming)